MYKVSDNKSSFLDSVSDKKIILDFIQENASIPKDKIPNDIILSPNTIKNNVTSDLNIINVNMNKLGIDNININNIPINNYKIDDLDILINDIEINENETMKNILIDEKNTTNYNSSKEEFLGAIEILSNTISKLKSS